MTWSQWSILFVQNFTFCGLWLTGCEHQTAETWISRTELAVKLAQGAWPLPPSPIGIAENVWGNWLWRLSIWTRFVWLFLYAIVNKENASHIVDWHKNFFFTLCQLQVDGKPCVTPGHAPVCGTCAKKFCRRTAYRKGDTVTADPQFGVSATTGSYKPWSSVLDSDPISVRTKVPSAGVFCAIYFWFPATLPEYLLDGSKLSGKCVNLWNCLHKLKWIGWHW